MVRPSKPILAITVAILVLMPGASPALDLVGTISLGRGLAIVIEISEGFISELLRTIHLRSAPRAAIDLGVLGQSGDRLFIGTDFNLYCEQWAESGYSSDRVYKVGNATRLWDIKTLPGIKLREVQSPLGNFTGEAKKRLRVDGQLREAKPSDVERTGFKFWLDEIVYQYDNPSRRKGKIDNFMLIVASVLDALPSSSDESQERFTHYKVLAQHIREAKDGDLIPFRDVLKRKVSSVKRLAADPKGGGDRVAPLLKAYEDLQAEVFKRTEGL